ARGPPPPAAPPATRGGGPRPRRDGHPPGRGGAGGGAPRRYAKDRRYAQDHRVDVPHPDAPYAFTPDTGHRLRVSFACPTCHQRIRVPVRGRVRARCAVCRTVLECDT
ncbi:hypothetical protein OK074_9092, partial [Actinobacteria bacterium OK074]